MNGQSLERPMKSRPGRRHVWAMPFAALFAAAALLSFVLPSGSRGVAEERDTVSSGPDKCTRCHEVWSRTFDYYRGWDRYGCIFDGSDVVLPADPWLFPKMRSTAREYYTTSWWDTGDSYVWPSDIADRAYSMSMIGSGKLPPVLAGQDTAGARAIIVSLSAGGAYSSIQDAINAAQPGTVVAVREGTYRETIRLKPGIRLIGRDPAKTVIDPQNRGHAIIAANDCRISGFTLTGTGLDYENRRMNAGIYVPGCDSTLVITGNIFRENGLFGIWVDGVIDSGKNTAFDAAHPWNTADYADRPYAASANPVIAGNTFYRIGQRAVFLTHGRSEIFNNIFIGNVKTIGMERHSRPFIHHNVFYLNNITMAVNRSEPIIANNIMYHNQWGQRLLKGSNPAIFGNVTWESPHFRDFDESGRPVRYRPVPGTGELEVDPLFSNPQRGDFRFKGTSTLQNQTTGIRAVGIMRDPGLPQPPQVACEGSFGREVLALTDDVLDLIRRVDAVHALIRSVEASYRIEYTGWYDLRTFPGGIVKPVPTPDAPTVKMEYEASAWTIKGNKRTKTFREHVKSPDDEFTDSGTIRFNGNWLEVTGSRFSADFPQVPDVLFIGERPFREAPLGIYRDYDQYYTGAAGPMGTSFVGYLRVLGGRIEKKREVVDGRSCVKVRYPHIGKDQYFHFWLDPARGYRPMRIVQYFNEKPFRIMDSYRYREFEGGVFMPVAVSVTDYVVAGAHTGKKAAEWRLTVNETSLLVNGKPYISGK